MFDLPTGWKLFAWVGPLTDENEAEDFEAQWKSRGKRRAVRNIADHITSAFQLLSSLNYTHANVHFRTS